MLCQKVDDIHDLLSILDFTARSVIENRKLKTDKHF